MKVFYFFKRSGDTSREEFEDTWTSADSPSISGLNAYVRSVQRKASDGEARRSTEWAFGSDFPFDGVAELWFDHWAAFQEEKGSVDAYFESALNGVADSDGATWFAANENVVVDGPLSKETPSVKALFFPSRKAGTSVEQFGEYWRTKHADIVPDTPKLMRYVQSHVAPEMYEGGKQPFSDGVAELWWRSEDDVLEGLNSYQFQEQQPEDASHFVNPDILVGFLTDEERVIWP